LPHAERAIAIDANNPDAYEVRGNLRYWMWLSAAENDSAKRETAITDARADLEKATLLNRNQAGAWSTLSHLYYYAKGATTNDVYVRTAREKAINERRIRMNTLQQLGEPRIAGAADG